MTVEAAALPAGWNAERERTQKRSRRRDNAAPVAAALVLMASHFMFGASQPLSALTISAALIVTGLLALALAGPTNARPGMVIGALAIWAFAAFGWAGPLSRASVDLAALTAAGSLWIVGYIAARQRGALDGAWTILIWTSLVYCVWFFFSNLALEMTGPTPASVAASFESPTSAGLLYTLFALLGCSRVLHVVKRVESEAASATEMMDRMLRDGLGGLLLTGFSLTCLLIGGSKVGIIFAAAVLLAYVWWDTLSIMERQQRGPAVRFVGWLAPQVAFGLAAWGLILAYLQSDPYSPSLAIQDGGAEIQRVQAYFDAWLSNPVFGHGLGSIASVGEGITTLDNANAMLAPGGAQNVALHWLVETGVVGTGMLAVVLVVTHVRIFAGLGTRRTPRTFLRLALAAGALMLLHGASESSLDLPSAVWLYALLLGAACGVANVALTSKRKR